MTRHSLVYVFSFGFSTFAAIFYSFVADKISIIAIACLFSSVIYLSLISTTLLDIESKTKRFQNFLLDFQLQRNRAISMLVDELHRPSVRLLSNRLELVKSLGTEIRSRSPKSEIPIVFVGAIALQTPDEADDSIEQSLAYDDEDEQSPYQVYQGALEEAASKSIPIQRFVQLPDEDEIRTRSKKWARDYLRWLENQSSQMSRNDNFILINSPRSPKWGAAGARILLAESIYDITYKGGVTIHIRDSRIVNTQKEKVVLSVLSGRLSNVVTYCSEIRKAKVLFGAVNANGLDEMAMLVTRTKALIEETFH